MSLPIRINDGKGGGEQAHLHNKNGDIGLVTYTHPLQEYTAKLIPFLNSDFGVQMAIDASLSGSLELVHDGLDNSGWTGSNITGTKVTFDSGDRSNSGTKSILVDNPPLGS